MRVLDSKDEGDQARSLPKMHRSIFDHLTRRCRGDSFDDSHVRAWMHLGIDYVVNPKIVRGLDYYCHTAFEFVTDQLGAQGTVIGGGRYDGLMEQMGGPATPGVGWAGGIERLAMMAGDPPPLPRPYAILPVGEGAGATAQKLAHDLRRAKA